VTPRLLVTGGSGFIGTALIARLVSDRTHSVRMATRNKDAFVRGTEGVVAGDVSSLTNWRELLAGVNTVVHLAARVHVQGDRAAGSLNSYREVNTAGTLHLAREAALAGAKRFVFLSTVKIHGERGSFRESDPPAPQDHYAISKHEAEVGLRSIAAETGLEVVIIRTPLVYGPGVKANFLALMRAVSRGIPLPFGSVRNLRSLIALDNLVDVILVSAEHPAAARETFLVSDGEDVSTPALIRRLATAMGRRARLLNVPPTLLLAAATAVGRRDDAQRLLGSLQVDSTKVRTLLGWTPPLSVDEGLRRAVGARR
jgi:nucleoside-diphosphate-sugar epimerase